MKLLGPPAVESGGAAVSFDTRKATALFAFLAVEGGAHPRDRLAGFLWPEGDLAHGRGALRRTLSSLRKHLDDEHLRADRNSVELTSEITTDVGEFKNHLAAVTEHHEVSSQICDDCIERLRNAADLCSGSFMAGFELRDSSAFDEWRYVQEEELRKELSYVLQSLATALADRGSYREALPFALRWVELDPLHEPAHAHVIRLHALNDDRNAALEQYRRLVRILDEELGVAPLEETSALQSAVASGSLLEARRVPSRGHEERRVETPFVGRASESAILAGAARSASGSGRIVAIEGEAGIGKTRLAREAAARVLADGGRVYDVTCHEEEKDHPFGLVTRLLTSVIEDLPASSLRTLDDRTFVEVSRLVPDVRPLRPDLPRPAPLVDPGAKTGFFDALWQFFSVSLDGTHLLLEDLQWSDEASIDVLTFFTRKLTEVRSLFVLTWRTEEVTPEGRIRRLLNEAKRAGVADHLVLSRLGCDEVAGIVAACVPSASSDVARLVYEESEGLPFFVSEYVELFAAGGTTEDLVLPQDALDIVRARLNPIAGSARQVLAAASVLGRSFDLSLVQATAGRSDEETIEALEELVRRSVLTEITSAGVPAYDFTHEKIRSLVYEETSGARRRLLHARAADFLTSPHPGVKTQDVSLAAYHAEMAGRSESAANLHFSAGERARQLFANVEALTHFERALALDHPDVAGLRERIGDVQVLLGRYDSALRSYETAAAYADQARVPILERSIAEVHMRSGDHRSARDHLSIALDTTEAQDPLRPHLLADLGYAVGETDPEEAAAVAKEAVATGEGLGSPGAVARAHNLLGLLARREGRAEDAIVHLSRGLEAAETADDAPAVVAVLNNLALVKRQDGALDEAVTLTRRALELCGKRGDVHRAAALHNNLADLLHESGDEEGSRSHAKEAARLFASVGEQEIPDPQIWRLTEW